MQVGLAERNPTLYNRSSKIAYYNNNTDILRDFFNKD